MVAAQQRAEPPITATPRADCLPGGIPEGPMQARVPAGVAHRFSLRRGAYAVRRVARSGTDQVSATVTARRRWPGARPATRA